MLMPHVPIVWEVLVVLVTLHLQGLVEVALSVVVQTRCCRQSPLLVTPRYPYDVLNQVLDVVFHHR